jgi:uncharacterized membrane protein
MKDFFQRLANHDLPTEFYIGIVAVCLTITALFWYFLTRDDKPSAIRSARAGRGGASAFGLISCVLGALAMAFFFFAFDVSVLAGNGGRVANLDLLNQRQGGIIIGGFLFLAGVLVMALRRK